VKEKMFAYLVAFMFIATCFMMISIAPTVSATSDYDVTAESVRSPDSSYTWLVSPLATYHRIIYLRFDVEAVVGTGVTLSSLDFNLKIWPAYAPSGKVDIYSCAAWTGDSIAWASRPTEGTFLQDFSETLTGWQNITANPTFLAAAQSMYDVDGHVYLELAPYHHAPADADTWTMYPHQYDANSNTNYPILHIGGPISSPLSPSVVQYNDDSATQAYIEKLSGNGFGGIDNRYNFLKFDLSSVPSGATISGIMLFFYMSYHYNYNNGPITVNASSAFGGTSGSVVRTPAQLAVFCPASSYAFTVPNNQSSTYRWRVGYGMNSNWQTQFDNNATIYMCLNAWNFTAESSYGINLTSSYIVVHYSGGTPVTTWAPTFTSSPTTTVQTGNAYSYQVIANESVTGWTMDSNATFLSFASGNHTVYGRATGAAASYYVHVNATSLNGTLNGWHNYTLTVTVPTWAPTFTSSMTTSITNGFALSNSVTWNESVTGVTLSTNASWLHYASGNTTLYGRADTVGWYYVHFNATSVAGSLIGWHNYSVNVTQAGIWAPTITSSPVLASPQDYLYEYHVLTNETCTFAMTSNATFLSVGGSSGIIQGVPTTSPFWYWVHVNATSVLGGLTAYQNYTFNVTIPTNPTWTGHVIPTADTYIVSGLPNNNYGTSTSVYAGVFYMRSMFRWNLSGVIPVGATIYGINFLVWKNYESVESYNYLMEGRHLDWAENRVTWNTLGSGYCYEGSFPGLVGTFDDFNSGSGYWINLSGASLTSTANNMWQTLGKIYLTILGENIAEYKGYDSKEGTHDPYIRILYALPNPYWGPTYTSSPVTTAGVGDSYTYHVTTNCSTILSMHTNASWLSLAQPMTPSGHAWINGTAPWTAGTYWVNISAYSTTGSRYTHQNYTITLTNSAPVFTSTMTTPIGMNDTFSYHAHATDADGGTLVYGLDTDHPSATIDANGWVNGSATLLAGSFYVHVNVTDGNVVVWQNNTLVVNKLVITSTPITTGIVNTPYTYQAVSDSPATWALVNPSTVVSFQSVADSTLSSNLPDANWGMETWLYAYNNAAEGLVILKWDLSSLPVGAQVIDTRLHIYKTSNNGADLNFYEENNSAWTESGVTWNNVNRGGYRWTIVSDSGTGWMNYPVLSNWVNDEKNYTGMFSLIFGGDYFTEKWYQGRQVAGYEPHLVITYVMPSFLTINATTGLVTGTPTAQGTYDVNITATSTGAGGEVAYQNYTLTITSWFPHFDTSPVLNVNGGVAYYYDADANESCTYLLDSGTTATFLTINSTTGVVSGTPTVNEIGTYEVDIRATNVPGNSVWQNYTLTVHDITPPSADAGPDQVKNAGVICTFDGTGSTDNVGVVNYTWSWTEGGVHYAYGVHGTAVFYSAGVFTVTLTVRDAVGLTDIDTMTVTVTVVDVTPPVANAGGNQTHNVDKYGDYLATFSGSYSTDNVGIVNYTWNFTDDFGNPQTRYGVTFKFNFHHDNISITVQLVVRDAAGNLGYDNMTLRIYPNNPPAPFGIDVNGIKGMFFWIGFIGIIGIPAIAIAIIRGRGFTEGYKNFVGMVIIWTMCFGFFLFGIS